MITEYMFLTPSGEILYDLHGIRQYLEQYYADRQPCPHCGCYLIPTGERHKLVFRVYRCANSICSATQRTFKLWPFSLRRAA
jgi:hypothetical protein